MRRLIGLLILLTACAGIARSPEATVKVELDEFYLQAESVLWRAGRIEVAVLNDGAYPHTMVVTRADGHVLYATPVLASKESVSLRLNLDPGTYQLTCRLVLAADDGAIIDHYELGMSTAVTVADA
jgi:hypothetical protein